MLTGIVAERFWAKVNKDGPIIRPELGACWVWTAARDRKGYGVFKMPGLPMQRAHRVALCDAIGRWLPPEDFACHQCDNPACVRPTHLYVGDQKANMRDRVIRGHFRSRDADRRAGESFRARYENGTFINWQSRKTHCKHGHEFTPENTKYERGGKSRKCKTCNRAKAVKRYAAQKAAA